MLGSADAPQGWEVIRTPQDIAKLGCNTLLVEGGAATAAGFLREGLVDKLMLYRAPILIGAGKACLNDIGLAHLNDAHGSWQLTDSRSLGKDRLEVYEKAN
jgi:diaminohydroxyphosphoribosylaminopyrimidine deaminase/5-amino-6-(5-phosphoribosylamino)uracil reductase